MEGKQRFKRRGNETDHVSRGKTRLKREEIEKKISDEKYLRWSLNPFEHKEYKDKLNRYQEITEGRETRQTKT